MPYQPNDATANRTAGTAMGGCVSVVFMMGGLAFFLFYGVPDLRQALETWDWTTTQGRIVKSTIGSDDGSH